MNALDRIITLTLACFALIATSGCEDKDKKVEATLPKQAISQFTIAYLPNESTEQNADARNGMAKDLSALLGVKVIEYQASDYNAVIEAMRTNKVDMAYFGPLSFCLAYERANAEPIGMKAKTGKKEDATYKSVLIVKAESSIRSIKDLKGKTIAFVDPNSTSGNLIPSAEIMQAFPEEKLDMDALHTNGVFFSSVMFSGKHQAGLQAVLKGDVDVAPISDEILKQEIKNGNAPDGAVKIIHSSSPIPAEPMAIRSNLPDDVKAKVKHFILTYNNEEYFEKVIGKNTARFVECTIEDYKNIIELNKRLNK